MIPHGSRLVRTTRRERSWITWWTRRWSPPLSESVKPHHADKEELSEKLRYLLDYADAFSDADTLFTESEREAIVRAIAEIKILDPAVGSGAFPMSMLHKLTLALGSPRRAQRTLGSPTKADGLRESCRRFRYIRPAGAR